MHKIQKYKVISNKQISSDLYEMTLQGDTSWCQPGKFFNIKIPGFYLRRPMGVCLYNQQQFNFIYAVIGNGTKALSEMKANTILDIMVDLGNTYWYKKEYGKPLLLTGGGGLGPIVSLGKKFKDENIPFEMIVGFNNKDKVAYEQEMKQLCPNLIICTDDGSYGEKGNVVEIIKKHHFENLYYFVCGAPGLIKAVYKNCQRGQISLDARMGCGFGACMGCSIKTKNGWQRICKDGAVFDSNDLLW